jgi:hypothetical protein
LIEQGIAAECRLVDLLDVVPAVVVDQHEQIPDSRERRARAEQSGCPDECHHRGIAAVARGEWGDRERLRRTPTRSALPEADGIPPLRRTFATRRSTASSTSATRSISTKNLDAFCEPHLAAPRP